MTTSPPVPGSAGEDLLPASPSSTAMRDYAAFGGVLRTDLEFPDLAEAAPIAGQRPDWTVDVAHTKPSDDERFAALGERELGTETYRLTRSHTAFRLEYSHAGCFDIALDGRRITWYYRADALPELVRSIILGPALAIALELRGFLCLHGSAVLIDRRAIAFVGPKFFGKSTIAAALVAAGARLVGDDLLAVDPGPPPVVRPGIASLRLWRDTVDALVERGLSGTTTPGLKTTIGLADHVRILRDAPLAAVYVLRPLAPDSSNEGVTVRRTKLSTVAGTIALAQQAKLADSLVGLAAAGARLRPASQVAGAVPVWTLDIVRDFARLERVIERLFAWTFGDGARPVWNDEEEFA